MELTKENILLAQTGHRTLRERIGTLTANATRVFINFENSDEITLPPQAVRALADVLEQLASGREVVVTAHPVEMTTQQAADYLRVSRPFLIGLLDKNEIPHRKVGSHRRILFADVQAYKERIDQKRLATLTQLSAQAQELKMGY